MIRLMGIFAFAVVLALSGAIQASHNICEPPDETLNRIIADFPGSKVLATYSHLDALMYLGFLNKAPTGASFITADEIIVITSKRISNVLALTFHEGCFTGGIAFPRMFHDNWNRIIIGPEA